MFSQEGCILGPIATHKYNGIVVDKNEQKMLRKSLGKKAKILMLANHGACVLGETVEEAWHYLYNLMYYCKTFMSVMSCNLHQNEKAVPEKFKKKTYEIVTGIFGNF